MRRGARHFVKYVVAHVGELASIPLDVTLRVIGDDDAESATRVRALKLGRLMPSTNVAWYTLSIVENLVVLLVR